MATGSALVLAALVAGCAAPVSQAPFPSRPDTVVPGSLLGPFDGRVLDADTGKPLEGASVLAAWAMEEGRGLSGPALAPWRLVESDSDGRYRVPRLDDPSDGRLVVRRFTLMVYKRGYVGWRSDRRFEDLSPRHDFAQTGNQVKLARLPPDVSHARHVAFVGAAGPLLSRVAWELPLAAEETTKPPARETTAPAPAGVEAPPPAKEAPPLDARVLLDAAELKSVTGFAGEFTVEPLPDLPTTPNYDSVHFRAEGRPERYDAAMRVFRIPPAQAEKQFEVMLKELPDAKERKQAGLEELRLLQATQGDVLAIGALDRARGVVLLFTCGNALCGDQATALGLVKRMAARFGRLGRAPARPATPPVEKPAAPPPQQPPPASEPPPEQDVPRLELQPPEQRVPGTGRLPGLHP